MNRTATGTLIGAAACGSFLLWFFKTRNARLLRQVETMEAELLSFVGENEAVKEARHRAHLNLAEARRALEENRPGDAAAHLRDARRAIDEARRAALTAASWQDPTS